MHRVPTPRPPDRLPPASGRRMRVACPEGAIAVEAAAYRLTVRTDRPLALLADPDGTPWGTLALLADVDATDGRDATYASDPPAVDVAPSGDVVRIDVRQVSARWGSKLVRLTCRPERIDLAIEVSGSGALDDVRLLGGRIAGLPGWPSGSMTSSLRAGSLLSPSPADPRRVVAPPGEPAVIGVDGASRPGGGHWFFTPGPFCLLFGRGTPDDPLVPPAGPWLSLGIDAPAGEATFHGVYHEPSDGASSLRLAYDGETRIDGPWRSPAVTIGFADDPYAGLAAYRAELEVRGSVPSPASATGQDATDRPAWWSEPIFCGWGAQGHVARTEGGLAPDHATQARYDAFLAALEARGIVPGTIVVDDKWQAAYGTADPDPAKWPDLRAWVAERHARGQRVLLWWKAWDPEGLPSDACIRTPIGRPVAADPAAPAYRAIVRAAMGRLLGPDGIDADGLKVDSTAHTPTGPGLVHAGRRWGVELLLELLELLHEAATAAKPDALVVTHAPNPLFRRVGGMVRLNDLLRLDDPVQPVDVVDQMRYRAAVVRAACPELLIDTDDWGVPSLAAWRRYLRTKPALGVPALYYATHLDVSGEALEPEDDAAIREAWAAWRRDRADAGGRRERADAGGRPA